MSRYFQGASDFLYRSDSALQLVAVTFSVHLWVNIDSGGDFYCGWWGGGGDRPWLLNGAAGGTLNFALEEVGVVSSVGNLSTGTWQSCGASHVPATRAACYLQGVKATTATGLTTTSAAHQFELGRAAIAVYSEAKVAELAIWSGVELSDAEFSQLSTGVSPLFIQPGSLILYAPLEGTESPEPDLSGNNRTLAIGTSEPAQDASNPDIYVTSVTRTINMF